MAGGGWRRWARAVASATVLCALAACSHPLPEARRDYIGDWRAADMRLVIAADGTVAYARRVGSTTTRIDAPIQRFDGDNLVVGVWFFSTTFVVTRTPHQNEGRWTMVVDGVELTRTDAAVNSTSI